MVEVFRLKQNDISRLSQEPETGMGYQLIKAAVDGKEDLFFLFNCELLVSLEEVGERGGCFARELASVEGCSPKRRCEARPQEGQSKRAAALSLVRSDLPSQHVIARMMPRKPSRG